MNPILQPLDNRPRAVRTRRPVGRTELPRPTTHGPHCAARQALGTRVCDQAHGHHGPHVGDGDNDPRGAFWGTT